MGAPFPRYCPTHGRSGPHLKHGSLGDTRVLNPNGIWIDTAVFAGLTGVTDQQTDRQTS